jgi:hypothetical protein
MRIKLQNHHLHLLHRIPVVYFTHSHASLLQYYRALLQNPIHQHAFLTLLRPRPQRPLYRKPRALKARRCNQPPH